MPVSAEQQVQRTPPPPAGGDPFQPLPAPTGTAPFHLALSDVLTGDAMAAIEAAGALVFHCVGDTGGIMNPTPQQAVATAMSADLTATPAPSFLFHLGDVVYFNGESAQYYPQFYEPYADYQAPIFAIPGNHDGDPINAAVAPSLSAFVANFCAPTATRTPTAHEVARAAMTQPNVYWTLDTPFVTIVGLYTNVPEGGVVGDDQARWLAGELAAAPTDRALIVALHHPVYSADTAHGGSTPMGTLLDAAFAQANRTPTAVLCGHVHNYQRFSRTLGTATVPYIVAGAGGYHNLHHLAKDASGNPIGSGWQPPGDQGVTLESACVDQYGYLRLTASSSGLAAEYVGVGHLADLPGATPAVLDTWTAPLGTA
jgi:hypothetical protein